MKKFDHTQLHTNIFAHTKIEYIILFHIGTIVQKMMIPLNKIRIYDNCNSKKNS